MPPGHADLPENDLVEDAMEVQSAEVVEHLVGAGEDPTCVVTGLKTQLGGTCCIRKIYNCQFYTNHNQDVEVMLPWGHLPPLNLGG